MLYLLKIVITSIIIVAITEISKRSTIFGALLASLPLTSILALIWIYCESKDMQKIIDMSNSIFWLVLPSLLFFVILPIMLKAGYKFPLSMFVASSSMIITYISGLSLYTYWLK